ncbi:MAG: peptidyl-alpha-hydroxyglycine alpha-amidating lyase family protein [Gammaproteobacteria bacterium]|nr:peptidyl-alpha-hydroxyglycine alpha-amidating lyase family protein [Gammaproteobacteria bacterium]
MKSTTIYCLLWMLLTTSEVLAQRPNRLLFPLQAYTLTDYEPIEFSDAFNMPAAFMDESYAAIQVTNEGNLLIFSRGSRPFLEFTSGGDFIRSFGSQDLVRRAHGLTLDEEGGIWITDVADHVVMKLDSEGNEQLTIGTRGHNGLWDEATGEYFLDQPNDLALDSQGNVYIAQGHGAGEPRVLKFSPNGNFIRQWGSRGFDQGQFWMAHAIEIDANDIVYVADRENMRIHRYDTEGNFLGEWLFDAMVCALHLHTDGYLYITTGFDGQLARVDMTGRVLGAIGRPGRGNGEFGEAHALTLDLEDNAYIADVINRRIQKYARVSDQ